ncbi:MAG: hypothetical protein ABI851_12075 [Saprospiraceae bacterium]
MGQRLIIKIMLGIIVSAFLVLYCTKDNECPFIGKWCEIDSIKGCVKQYEFTDDNKFFIGTGLRGKWESCDCKTINILNPDNGEYWTTFVFISKKDDQLVMNIEGFDIILTKAK